MRIIVEFLPKEEMRYDTAGDYWRRDDVLTFQVRDTDSSIYNRLVLIHEMVEQLLTEHAGIHDGEIDEYDMAFEGAGEPGDALDCPYHTQHSIATGIERMLCGILGFHWELYERSLDD